VGDDVARQFPAETVRSVGDVHHLDLVAAARLQLEEAGVPAGHIHDVAACTACEPAYYFSHRRDGARTGRHWAVAALDASNERG
jgi:copper oxidase (laccase) domain-containing protein